MRTAAFCVLAFAITSILFINFCNLVYQCGCKSLWNGADEHCNIHNKHGKHCPWCSHGETGYHVIFSAMLLPQIGVTIATRRKRWWQQLSATVVSFPVCAGILAVIVGLMDGYWKS